MKKTILSYAVMAVVTFFIVLALFLRTDPSETRFEEGMSMVVFAGAVWPVTWFLFLCFGVAYLAKVVWFQ